MVRLKSRQQCPVNGFWFVQPETGFREQTWDFESLVQKVQAMRQANPRFKLTTDLNAIREEVDQQNALRMLKIKGADSYISSDGGMDPKVSASHSTRPSWRNVVGGVKRVGSGAVVLLEWLGSGAQPVAGELAEARAAVCAKCPQNEGGDWLSLFTQPVAEKIRQQVSMRKDLNLSTTVDERLEFCKACSCPLKLKVHVPLDHITAHQSDAVKAALDPGCWILKEMTEKGP